MYREGCPSCDEGDLFVLDGLDQLRLGGRRVELGVASAQLSFDVPAHRHHFAVLGQAHCVVRRHRHVNHPLFDGFDPGGS